MFYYLASYEASVVVTNANVMQSDDEVSYDYLLSETAVVTGVSPQRGGTGGGTEVTITGRNFE